MRTRFAPSPTGYLHIGGVRTALFNWLLARQSGGQFILRIDDTDAGRNVNEAIQPILDGFRWLGMDWDEGPEVGGPHEPYYQSQRAERHRQAAEQLLASGHAYRDFSRPEELQQQREAAQKEGKPFIYDRRWMAADDAAAAAFEAEGRTAVVRLKMPREGQCVINDLIRGEVVVDWASEQDHVIQRADGSCLYHLANVVDDHDFEITHVVRAAEHLPNTARQVFILESLGYPRPQYAHLPYVAEPGGTAKLSKRKLDKYTKNKGFADLLNHGRQIADACSIATDADTFNPVIVDFYREIGFLPSAVLNYLLLLGWSLDGETEKFDRQQMIDQFTLDRVNKAPASFDPQKLVAFQADAFAALSIDDRLQQVAPFAIAAGFVDSDDDPLLKTVVQAADDRLKIAGDIVQFGYCFTDDYTVDQKAFEKRVVNAEGAAERLAKLKEDFLDADAFDHDTIAEIVKAFCDRESIKLKDIIHSLRLATTGQPGGFGMFETLAILGQERTCSRMDAAIAKASA
ncbi:glutamate--tRNA ligase [Crateriforma spongiae]|uniref:glutamate--tRNA ligase n=1 Tax=Crateriforma spongiae TaxID=2724528 RepID=UPI001446DEBF|nr:glutamate--tRNA ligase [Crateriforma spongiae]